MTKRSDRLIDKLRLENLSFENLKKIIEFESEASTAWSLNDQLDAIDLLSYTASEEALLYLQKIYKPFVVVKQNIDWSHLDGAPNREANLFQHYNYPNARGPLADALHYEIPLFKNARLHLKRLKAARELESEKRTLLEKSMAHNTINRALERLRQSLAEHLE